MRVVNVLALSLVFACAITTVAEQAAQPPQQGQRGQGRGGRGRGGAPLTPEQQAQREKQRAAQALADGVRPIEALDTVWIEEQTWMETRDAIKAGKTTAIVGSGGNEKNGPYNANGKHNYVIRTTCEAIARKLGNALCAPVVTMEPGNTESPNITPGAVFITQDTFRAVLRDMSTSLKSMGFKDIVMIADSGGNVTGMTEVAKELNAKWQGNPARVHYISEYYEEDKWSYNYLKTLGILQQPDVQNATRWDIHDDYHYESLVALQNPKLIRAEQRIKANKFTINGVEIGSVEKMLENGRKLAEYRAKITVDAIHKAFANFKPTQQ